MKLIKKPWFAVVILLLAIATSVAIGLSKHESRVIENDRVFNYSQLDTSLTLDYMTVKDSEKMISEDGEDKLQVYNANFKEKYDSIIYLVSCEEMEEDDLDAFAMEKTYSIDSLFTDKDAMIILLKDNDDFIMYVGENFPFTIDDRRANDIRIMIKSAYSNDLESGIIKVYNKFMEYFGDTSTVTGRSILCFAGKSDKVTYSHVESDDTYIPENEIIEKIKNVSNWKWILIACVVLWFIFGRKKTSYK